MAKTLISEANFLLLDEPTNHLDFQSVNILIQALQQYEGTFVTVSHDRHFIKGVANKIWYIEEQEIKEYPGTYEEFELWKANQIEVKPIQQAIKVPKKEVVITPKTNEETQLAKKELKKLEELLRKVESEVELFESDKKKIEIQMADSELYTDEVKAQQIQNLYQDVEKKLDRLNAEWESLVDQISTLQEVNF